MVPAKNPLIDVVQVVKQPVPVAVTIPEKEAPVIVVEPLDVNELTLFATVMFTPTVEAAKSALSDPLTLYPIDPSVVVGLV